MEQQLTVQRAAMRGGLVLGLGLCLMTVLLSTFDMVGNQWASTLISIVLWVGVLYWSMNEYKQANEGIMLLKQGFTIGTLAVIIGTIISMAFLFIYANYIDPGYWDSAMELGRQRMEDQGMSEEQIDTAMEQASGFMWVGIVFGIIFSIILGMIVSVIMAAILQKKPEGHA
jgi:hypothetical protein